MPRRTFALLALAIVSATPAWADEGTSAAAPPVPAATSSSSGSASAPVGAAPPFEPGEEIDLAIDYLHVRTGQAKLIVGRPEGAVWPVMCQARTDGVASLLDIREHYVSYWDAETGTTRGSDLNALEVGDRHTDRARIDRVNGKATVQVVRKGRLHESTHDVPRDVHDLASALLRVRMEPLARGDHVELPVLSGTDVFLLQADVEAEERVDTPAGSFDTVRVRVRLGFKEKFRTSRDAYFWFSSDRRHVPVRASADFAVGSVTATIVGYRPGTPYASRAETRSPADP